MCVVVLAGWLFGSGCSSFNRHWEEAGRMPGTATGMSGRWEGTWRSEANGHEGGLRCLVTEQENGLYEAWFRATYHRVFDLHFGYKVPLTVERTNGVYRFEGEADLGWLAGGIYHYEGEATAEHFFSRYRSRQDQGTFDMRRPGEAKK